MILSDQKTIAQLIATHERSTTMGFRNVRKRLSFNPPLLSIDNVSHCPTSHLKIFNALFLRQDRESCFRLKSKPNKFHRISNLLLIFATFKE